MRLRSGNAETAAKGEQFAFGLRIENATACDDKRLLRALQSGNGLGKLAIIRLRAAGQPETGREEFLGVIISFRLHILAESQRDRPTLGGVS